MIVAICYIGIKKIKEEPGIAYYKISTKDFGGAEFYMEIDRECQKLKFYLTKSFLKPIHVVDYKKNDPLGSIPTIDFRILSKVFVKAIKTLNLEYFPDELDYAA